MSNIIHTLSKVNIILIINYKDSKPFTKFTHHKTKSSISTLDDSMKIQAISQLYDQDSLFQEYVKMKEKRLKSQKYSSEILSKINYLTKEQQSAYNKIRQIKSDKLKQKQCYSYSLDAKSRHDLIHSKQEEILKKQKKKIIVIKASTDYIMRTWKDQIRVKNENKANKMRLVKFRDETMKSISKINENTSKQDNCARIKSQRAASAEKREQYFQKIKEEQKKELIKKILREQERKKEYDDIILSYKDKGQKILSRMEEIPSGINQILYLAHKLNNLPFNNDESDWTSEI